MSSNALLKPLYWNAEVTDFVIFYFGQDIQYLHFNNHRLNPKWRYTGK